MKFIARTSFAALFVFASACLAQEWEVGGMVGGGFSQDLTVSNAIGSAAAGFGNGLASGVILGHNLYPRVSGELRYTLDFSDLRISSAGASATFQGQTHSIHYDVLIHARSARSRVRPFALAGGGMRDFRGVGTESSYQELSNFALLTKTSQWTPVATFGGGVKYAIAPRVLMRLEVRDYFSRFPTQVIAPAPGARLSGWLHDLVPMAGITFLF
jgi:hypothetical protein